MTHVEFRTENGRRLAVLVLEDYERLVASADDASDAEIVRRHKAERPAGIPASVVNQLCDGENPVRVWREHRNLTESDLAAHAGITRAFLSQIETGAREMSVSTLRKLSAALETEIDFLL